MYSRISTLCFLLTISTLSVFSQKIEAFVGPNYNIFHDKRSSNPHTSSLYDSKLGYTFGFGLDSINISWITFRFTVQFENYGGKIDVSEGGQGYSNRIVADINKSIFSAGIFPINFRILKKIKVNLGLIYSRLIYETFYGSISGWTMYSNNWSYDIHDKYEHFSATSTLGIQGRIAYDIQLSKSNSIFLTPQYLYYYGFSSEFREFPGSTKSIRQYFLLGIKKKI